MLAQFCFMSIEFLSSSGLENIERSFSHPPFSSSSSHARAAAVGAHYPCPFQPETESSDLQEGESLSLKYVS